jgi:hypothetical protein
VGLGISRTVPSMRHGLQGKAGALPERRRSDCTASPKPQFCKSMTKEITSPLTSGQTQHLKLPLSGQKVTEGRAVSMAMPIRKRSTHAVIRHHHAQILGHLLNGISLLQGF